MKLSHSIRNQVELFTKSNYISQFESIMTNMANAIPSNVEKTKKKLLFNDQTQRNKSYWNEIIKSLFNKEVTNDSLPLDLSYMQLKAKYTLPKLALIATMFEIQLAQVLKQFFILCHDEIKERINLSKKSEEKDNKYKPKANLHKCNKHRPIKCNESIKEAREEEVKDLQTKDIELEPQQRRIINIFVGQADFKKLIRSQQKIVMQKGKYCQTFIISDIDNTNKSYTKPPVNPTMRIKKNNSNSNSNHPVSPPLTSKNSTSKCKSFCLNQDLSSMLIKNNSTTNFKSNISSIKIPDFGGKENHSFAFPSITRTASKTKTKFWQGYPGMQSNYIPLLPRSSSQACRLPISSYHTKAKKKQINYINKEDLYF